MSGDEGEKKHQPTERRLQQAAERGDIARSTDMPKAAAIMGTVFLGFSMFAGLSRSFFADCGGWLSMAGTMDVHAAAGWVRVFASVVLEVALVVALFSLAASFALGGWVFSIGLVKFDLSRLGLGGGLGHLLSGRQIGEAMKSTVKVFIIGGTAAAAFLAAEPGFGALVRAGQPGPGIVFGAVGKILLPVCAVIGMVAAADMALQYRAHRQRLRMSDQEIREEMKEAGGNPHVKSRQRMLARKMARARQMTKIGEATVVVANPTHYACAMRYRRGVDDAPLLLAKGVDLVAQEILTRARGHGVPIIEAPPLARAIYRTVEPGDHVPVVLYRACAEVLAYIWRMQRWRVSGGQRPAPFKLSTNIQDSWPG
ncbi:EscU/YscU/HrcU family type III secretion system export apparatus switch protein [Acidocella sp.]|uniref:EscU/YscU/HrcU family type III secretion system export apparatus switch protein n=1 Tax=Acidocella sp. TaxID=50710 RepID=UPI0026239BE9|nr:EscU/YscU/HrcU family type III secretion system export apparatus switch protein [Acidocella sp.]